MTAEIAGDAEPFSLLILAGGHGTRVGRDKASIVVAGRTLLEWTARAVSGLSDDVIVVRRADQRLPAPPGMRWRERTDRRAESGPLAGIEAGLLEAGHDLCVAVACDMPLVRASLVRAVAAACHDVDVVMPVLEDRVQPLLAAYRRACLPVVGAMLDAGEARPRVLLTRVRSRRLTADALREADAGLASFVNVNYPADLERVEAALRAGIIVDQEEG